MAHPVPPEIQEKTQAENRLRDELEPKICNFLVENEDFRKLLEKHPDFTRHVQRILEAKE